MYLQLWLDESGDFVSDEKEYLNPSLVGGVLVEKGYITKKIARQIIRKDYVHYNEESGNENLRIVEEIRNRF